MLGKMEADWGGEVHQQMKCGLRQEKSLSILNTISSMLCLYCWLLLSRCNQASGPHFGIATLWLFGAWMCCMASLTSYMSRLQCILLTSHVGLRISRELQNASSYREVSKTGFRGDMLLTLKSAVWSSILTLWYLPSAMAGCCWKGQSCFSLLCCCRVGEFCLLIWQTFFFFVLPNHKKVLVGVSVGNRILIHFHLCCQIYWVKCYLVLLRWSGGGSS